MDPLLDRFNNSQSNPSREPAGPAGHPASPWPAGPVWSPPTASAQTVADASSAAPVSPLGQPTTSTAVRKRGVGRFAAGTVAVAGLAGGAAGYVGSWRADHGSTARRNPAATVLSYASGTLDVPALVKSVEPSVVTI